MIWIHNILLLSLSIIITMIHNLLNVNYFSASIYKKNLIRIQFFYRKMFAQVLENLDYVGFLFKILLNSGD